MYMLPALEGCLFLMYIIAGSSTLCSMCVTVCGRAFLRECGLMVEWCG